MQLRNHERYAQALLNQALADFQFVKYFMDSESIDRSLHDPHMHAVIAKMHQVAEKLLKALLLFEEKGSFNPFLGHQVVKDWKENRVICKTLNKLFDIYHGKRGDIIKRLEELESLAPCSPAVENIEDDFIVAIDRNTEYPFHNRGQDPTWPAKEFNWEDAVHYYKITKTLMKMLANSSPYELTNPIQEYI